MYKQSLTGNYFRQKKKMERKSCMHASTKAESRLQWAFHPHLTVFISKLRQPPRPVSFQIQCALMAVSMVHCKSILIIAIC